MIDQTTFASNDTKIDLTTIGENGKEDIPATNGEKENNALDETALDWWSKYFASVETLAEEKKKTRRRKTSGSE